mgnify:CR=1 FL=1
MKKMLQRNTISNKMEYDEARREAKSVIRRRKKEFEENEIQYIQDKFKRNESRKIF